MDDFDQYRAEMNEKLLGSGHLGIKRFFALDTQAYEDGALDKETKELMGLTASIVLRCDDCITYHIKQCAECGVTREEFMDSFNVALVVGGSITIPHLRRAVDKLDQVLRGMEINHRGQRGVGLKSKAQSGKSQSCYCSSPDTPVCSLPFALSNYFLCALCG